MYQIYTEDIPGTLCIVDKYFPGYTSFKSTGSWRGKIENSLVIEIETNEAVAVFKLAEEIKRANKQEAVLVYRVNRDSYLV